MDFFHFLSVQIISLFTWVICLIDPLWMFIDCQDHETNAPIRKHQLPPNHCDVISGFFHSRIIAEDRKMPLKKKSTLSFNTLVIKKRFMVQLQKTNKYLP
jgi:hypothetical protein